MLEKKLIRKSRIGVSCFNDNHKQKLKWSLSCKTCKCRTQKVNWLHIYDLQMHQMSFYLGSIAYAKVGGMLI